MTEPGGQPMILVVDDDRGLARLIEKALKREGFAAAMACSGKDAIAWLSKNHADLLLLDLKLQDIEARDLVNQLAALNRRPPFIIITGQGDERVAVDMMKRGAMDYLVKDVDFLEFVPEVVKRALEKIETDRRLAEAETQVRLVQSVVDRGFSAVLIAGVNWPDPTVLYLNPAFAQLTGYRPEEMVGRPLSALERLADIQERLRPRLPEAQRFIEEVCRYETPEGERWGDWRIGPVKDKNGETTHWLIILRDITERKRLEREILEISDREQRRIGQDLHDGLCQHLTAIELMSQVVAQKLAARSQPEADRMGEIAGHVRNVIGQTRLLARGLSPVTLESEGLMSALKELALNTTGMFGVKCEFECRPAVLVDDHATATHLYRIAQEAVSNAIKHGHASEVLIRLNQEDSRVAVTVTDNGTGFPKIPPVGTGMGLRIMQSRAGMIGGALSVTNRPAGGASVNCSVSVPPGERPTSTRARKKEKSKREKADSDRR